MNRKFHFTNLTVFSLLALLMSCSQENSESQALAVRMNMELGTSNGADSGTAPEWNTNDKAGIVDPASGQTDIKSPVSGGSSSAMFVFNLDGIAKGAEIMGYFPAEKFSSVSSEGCTVNIPSEQDGNCPALYLGSISYKDNATMRLEPAGCAFQAHISKGDYSITKAVLKSNAGEKISGMSKISFKGNSFSAEKDNITITLKNPLDCSEAGQYITFLTAPATLSEGYTIEYTTNEGKTIKYTSSKETKLVSGDIVHSDNYLKILCIGNSFTQQQNPLAMLEKIASSQGYCFVISNHTHDGYTFAKHLADPESMAVIKKGGYDYAFIQDQSQAAANYISNKSQYGYVYTDTEKITGEILKYSPDCQLILELTWAFPAKNNSFGGFESYEKFDSLLRQGVLEIAKNAGTWISPIGPGFILAREKHPEIDLYNTDRKHQSEYGAYLKASVNYLVLTGRQFDENTDNYFLDAEKAKALRECAQEAVLGKESDYFIER